jgi:hypothetical protein
MIHLLEGSLRNSGNERLVAKRWAQACGHMHGQHVTTENTQGHHILWKNRGFIGQGGEEGDRL